MKIPFGQWLRIVLYWEFFDFPRYLLAQDSEGAFWVIEGSFNDEMDDYPEAFVVLYAGVDESEAIDQFKFRGLIPLNTNRSGFPSVPLSHVKFDDSHREQVMLLYSGEP
ncbi:MAG: hypothetical protein JNM58_00365 [Xanthomonadaceae bacterium]|nr:hypothetical protein [Xanthomonadaceae bacterium]